MRVRRVGVSAFGFGGTNFHMVMEEHIPGKLNGNGKKSISVPATPPSVDARQFRCKSAMLFRLPQRCSDCNRRSGCDREQGAAARSVGDRRCVGGRVCSSVFARYRRLHRPASACARRAGRVRSARAGASGHRLRRRRRSGDQVRQSRSKRSRQINPHSGKRFAPRESSADMVRLPRSHSSTPAKARST